MNKRKIENYLPKALNALKNTEECKIARNNNGSLEISKTFRGHISSFGAAVTMGSFKAAIAFFSKDKSNSNDNSSENKNESNTEVNRAELVRAMYYIVEGEWKTIEDIEKEIIDMSVSDISMLKEDFINASLALKLAMNAFKLVEEKK